MKTKSHVITTYFLEPLENIGEGRVGVPALNEEGLF